MLSTQNHQDQNHYPSLVLSKIQHADIIVVVIIAILTIAFIGLAFGLSYQDSKMIAREEVAAGKEIEVQEETVRLNKKEEK